MMTGKSYSVRAYILLRISNEFENEFWTRGHLKNEHSLLKFPYCTLNNKYIEHNDGIMRQT